MSTPALHPHVLLVNDSQSMLDLLRDLLEAAGHRVSVTGATLDLTRIMALAPRLIVQDLPTGRQAEAGWDFLTLMQLAPALTRIPVILCTAASELVNTPAMAANLDHLGIRVLLKPFTGAELVTAIGEMLTAQGLLDQARDGTTDEDGLSGNASPLN